MTGASDGGGPFDLRRFLSAQDQCFDVALREIKAGKKRSHWMWFVFPQLVGLGHSETSRYFGIRGLPEAKAYLADAVLGGRLHTATAAALFHSSKGAATLFGFVDGMKFHSSVSLFHMASGGCAPFSDALNGFFRGQLDKRTVELAGVAS